MTDCRTCRTQRGLSLVELLVGLVIGLAILAGAVSALTLHGRETLRAWREAQLAQAVAQAGDLVARDLRRAGHRADATRGIASAADTAPPPNPYAAIDPADPVADHLSYRYALASHADDAVADGEVFGVRLRDGVVELQLGRGNWQGLTDGTALQVTTLRITSTRRTWPLALPCAPPCTADASACRPSVEVRGHGVTIEARSVADPTLVRAFRARIRVRADAPVAGCLGPPV